MACYNNYYYLCIAQMAAGNPQMAAALQNPQVRAMLGNPQLMRQMMAPENMQVCKSYLLVFRLFSTLQINNNK